MKGIILSCLLLLFCISTIAQQQSDAWKMNAKLGPGINMGNAFEAPSETAWGNQWKPEYFKIMADLGFQHVRLPVRWEPADRSMAVAPYTIYPSFFSRIKTVVDKAISEDLRIIINMHHHDLLLSDPEGQKERFLSQWKQIAEFFKDYDNDYLLFEVMNEPHGTITPQMWNAYFAEALAEIRKTNPNRIVLMGTAEYGGLSGITKLELPDDDKIIVSPHFYSPFQFTHQGAAWVGAHADEWLGTKWLDTEDERKTIIQEFITAKALSERHNVPIHVGEFGAYSKADLDSRLRWTTFLARWFEEQNMSWAYWEFSAGFGIYNPSTKEILQPLADALLINPMPEPTQTQATVKYKSNFSTGTDGWSLQVQQGLSASLKAESGKLSVSITNGGQESWRVQLIKSGMLLEEGKMYRISIKTKAVADRNITFYVGRSVDPWNSYSGYSSLAIGNEEREYGQTFMMNSPTDMTARLVVDLGNSNIDVDIMEVRLEEISTVVTSVAMERLPALEYYPNPVISYLNLKNIIDYQQIYLYDLQGKNVGQYQIEGDETQIDLRKYPKGMYFLRFIGRTHSSSQHIKIIKE